MNGILSDKSKSLAFTGHRTVPVERQDEIRARLVEAVSLACRYIHSGTSIITEEDLEAVYQTVFLTAEKIAGDEVV